VLAASDDGLDNDDGVVGSIVETSEESITEELEATSTVVVAEIVEVSLPTVEDVSEIAEVVGGGVDSLENPEETRLDEMLIDRLEKRLLERLLDKLSTILLEIALVQLSGHDDGEGGVMLVSMGGDVVIGGGDGTLVDVTVGAGYAHAHTDDI